MDLTQIGKVLHDARAARGWTLRDVAVAAECGISSVCELERGTHADRPLPPVLVKVASVFGLEIVATYEVRPKKRGRGAHACAKNRGGMQ